MAIDINIGSKLDGKGFKQADTAITKLNKNTKNLARNFGLAFGTAAVLAYGRAAAKAFAEDDKAATALGTTLKNLNLAYGSNIGTVNGFISRLEQQTGVLDDELRPAMDRLLRATGDVTKSQELLGLALDIAAGTGKSVTQVSQSLQKAYLGQNQALGRLGVGLSKAELETSSFAQIQDRLNVLFAGQATAAADTYAGSLGRLSVASNNAKETIGQGLFDALKTISGSTSTDDFIAKIDRAAQSIANFARETGEFIKITKSLFDFKNLSFFAPSGGLFGNGKGFGNISLSVSSQDTQKADAIAKRNATAITKLTKEQSAAQAKILKDKRLGAAIDKANLALNKGTDVFDMDKIQIAAALTNQAEQLGKATSSAQVLQIANDIARLNVKKSILALEDAIASKDEAAITAATNKLNADLKVLGVLGQQNVKLMDIKSILDTLVPKDLINLQNLKDAIALLGQIKIPSMAATVAPSSSSVAKALESFKGTAASAFESLTAAQQATLGGYEPFVGASIPATNSDFGASGVGLGSNGTGRQVPAGVTINVNTGIGDPNAIAEAIENVLVEANYRGTLRGMIAV